MKVFLHTRHTRKSDWNNESREFGRLPVVGEIVALDWNSPWYKVQLVIHCPFEAQYQAEVFAVEVDHAEAQRQAFGDES